MLRTPTTPRPASASTASAIDTAVRLSLNYCTCGRIIRASGDISSASTGRRHDRARDVHNSFKATLDHGAPSRHDGTGASGAAVQNLNMSRRIPDSKHARSSAPSHDVANTTTALAGITTDADVAKPCIGVSGDPGQCRRRVCNVVRGSAGASVLPSGISGNPVEVLHRRRCAGSCLNGTGTSGAAVQNLNMSRRITDSKHARSSAPSHDVANTTTALAGITTDADARLCSIGVSGDPGQCRRHCNVVRREQTRRRSARSPAPSATVIAALSIYAAPIPCNDRVHPRLSYTSLLKTSFQYPPLGNPIS